MNSKNNQLKKCDICNINATSLCFQCNSYFCDQCFKYVHEKESNQKHKKEEIDFFVPIDTKCPEHPKIPMNLFCVEEKGKLYIYKYK